MLIIIIIIIIIIIKAYNLLYLWTKSVHYRI